MEFYTEEERKNYYEDLFKRTTEQHNKKIEGYSQMVSDCDKTIDYLKNDLAVKQYLELLNHDTVNQYIHALEIKKQFEGKIEQENKDFRKSLSYCCNHESALLIERQTRLTKCFCLKCQNEELIENYYHVIDIDRRPSESDKKNILEFYKKLVEKGLSVEEINNKIEKTFKSKPKKEEPYVSVDEQNNEYLGKKIYQKAKQSIKK